MKTVLLTLASLLAFGAVAADKTSSERSPLMDSDTAVWAGLDYSLARFVGPGDFSDPSAIFPGFLESWNELFLKERMDRAGKVLKKHLVADIGGVTEANKKAGARQIIAVGGPDDTIEKTHIKREDIERAVRDYKLQSKEGLGLVFIVDRLVKPEAKGAVYVVFFDVASRKVISTDRYVGRASGFGFRNFWFGAIKKVEPNLKAYR